MPLRFGATLFLITLLAACGQVRPAPQTNTSESGLQVVRDFLATSAPLAPYQIGASYEVNGVEYRPIENFSYSQSGVASFYSNALNGALTASGETYNSNFFTAAHKTLPFQTIVRVTHSQNGRSVFVRINDRGPFVNGRIIDLSQSAADALGMIQDGTARVQVEVMETETKSFSAGLANGRELPIASGGTAAVTSPNSTLPSQPSQGAVVNVVADTPPAAQAQSVPGGFYVLVGTYTNSQEAEAIRARMSSLGNATVEQASGVYKVYLGPLPSRLDAQAMMGRAFAQGATNVSVVQR